MRHRKKGVRTRKEHEKQGPSLFFLIVLTVALILFAWGVVRIVQTPVETPSPRPVEKPAGD